MRNDGKAILRLGAAAAVMTWLLAGTAFAQSAGDAGAATTDDEVIVVTAQKREERLQDVPISVSVLSGADLDAQATGGVSEALRSVAGLSLTGAAQGGGTQLTIRGVAANGATLAGSSTTAYYIDTVPFGLVKSAYLPDTSAYDMARIEVLRGPQGTLYGANALNGVVRLITNEADLERFEVKGRAGIADTKGGAMSYRGDVAVNVPLIEGKLAARIVAGFENAGGWIEQPNRGVENANEQRTRNLRVKINAQPTERLNIGLSTWISRIDQDSPNYTNTTGFQNTTAALPQQLDYDTYSARISYDFDGFTATSATSYLKFVNIGERDYTASGPFQTLHTEVKSKVFTEELLLNSTTRGSWRWSAGGFYRDAQDTLNQTLFLLPAPINFEDKSRSYAVFGQVTKALFDGTLELTGGLRYFNDRVSQIELTPTTGNPAQMLARRTETFDAVTPRVVVNWLPSADFTLYASYSQGFRSGFSQSPTIIRTAPGIPPVNADRLHNYEVGTKGTLLDGGLTFDIAVYYIDWKDIQQNLNVNVGGVVYAATVNGSGASGLGIDLGVNARPVRGVNIGGTFSWNGLDLDDPVVTQTAGGPITVYGRGDRLAFSPEYTASGYVDVDFPLGALEGKVSGSINYRSELPAKVLSAGVVRTFISDAPLTAQASLAITTPSNWTVRLFAENITNWNGVLQPTTEAGTLQHRLRPRTIGLQLELGL